MDLIKHVLELNHALTLFAVNYKYGLLGQVNHHLKGLRELNETFIGLNTLFFAEKTSQSFSSFLILLEL